MKQKIRSAVRKASAVFNNLYLSIGSSKECPICKWTGHGFMIRRFPNKPAPSLICPKCGSTERHRFAYLVLGERLTRKTDKVLHFAPEGCIEPWLRSVSNDYLSVDLCSPKAMAHMDITNLQLPDNEFTFIWCCHVLEHIVDDTKAMSELFRVLKPTHYAVVMVPVYGESTYEDPSISTPEERLKHFMQEDHLRLYGLDIANHLASVGFSVEVIKTSSLDPCLIARHELVYPSTQEIFLCTKPD